MEYERIALVHQYHSTLAARMNRSAAAKFYRTHRRQMPDGVGGVGDVMLGDACLENIFGAKHWRSMGEVVFHFILVSLLKVYLLHFWRL